MHKPIRLLFASLACLGAAAARNPAPLAWSTYFGSTHGDENWDIAVDSNDDVYVTGVTSGGLPATNGAYDRTYNGGQDCYVAKFSGTDGSLLWATYIGGPGYDEGEGILPLDGGDVIVCGSSQGGIAMPTGTYDTEHGYNDMFIARLSGDGTTFKGGMYLGGTGAEFAWERNRMAVDKDKNIYLTGITTSTDFPFSNGAAQTQRHGPTDTFVAELSPNLDAIVFATYLGGSGDEKGKAVALDENGAVCITGMTTSDDFPVTDNAYDDSRGGDWDVFLAKVAPDGKSIVYATYFGGSAKEYAWDMALDSTGRIYIAGKTHSTDFPATVGAYDSSFNGADDTTNDIMVARFSPDGTQLQAATFLGGSGSDISLGLALDHLGNVWLSGETASLDFPLSRNAYDRKPKGTNINCFIAALNPNLTKLVFGSYLGTKNNDYEGHIAVDSAGNPIVSGNTQSKIFPTTSGAFQTTRLGKHSSFITKLQINP